MTVKKLLLILTLFVGNALSAAAVSPIQPAAVVDDMVITIYDLQHRIDLTLIQTQTARTRESRLGIAKTVLENLILEHLRLGEAERLGLLPTKRELNAAIARYETERNIPNGGVEKYLNAQGVDYQSFVASISASLAWEKVVLEHLNPQLVITDAEVAQELERTKQALARSNAKEARLLLILLPERGAGDQALLTSAMELRKTILAGTQFSELARQFSADLSAQYGGDLGWLSLESLAPPIQQWLQNAQNNDLSPPIRLPEGVALFKLLETRTASADNLSEEAMRNRIGNIKLQTKIRGLERLLQREAVIDRKLKL